MFCIFESLEPSGKEQLGHLAKHLLRSTEKYIFKQHRNKYILNELKTLCHKGRTDVLISCLHPVSQWIFAVVYVYVRERHQAWQEHN